MHEQITIPPRRYVQKNAFVVPKLKMYTVLMNAGCHATQDGT